MASLYRLTKGDKEIFELTRKTKNPNVFLNYYLRSETSGTWWFPGARTERWKVGYEKLLKEWKSQKRPDTISLNGNTYFVEMFHEKSEEFPDQPAFFHNHGIMMLPWSKDLHYDRHPVRSIIGGFGSGKTMNLALSLLVDAAMEPEFRAFALAPMSIQANEVYEQMRNVISGTLYEERFLIRAPSRPFPRMIIGNDEVGENSIECYPILGNSQKIRTLTGDKAIVDQAEAIEDLDEVLRSIGTRFRGRTPRTGRRRHGTLTLIANSDYNERLWEIYDKAEYEPLDYLSLSPSSYDNIYLTDDDLHRFQLQVGDSDELKEQYLFGKRPLGKGEHFSPAILALMQDKYMDVWMEENKADPRYIVTKYDGVGVVEYIIPPKEGHTYLVISDPGTKNPPHRDSPPILVWDISEFPGTADDPKPARLVGFIWVYGNDNINNWATRYAETVRMYRAQLSNGFDATGFQSGYDTWISILEDIHPEKINLAGNGKWMCLNAAKILTANGMMKVPASLSNIYGQLSRYVYPEPLKLRQDIVMAFIMSAWWLQRIYFFEDNDNEELEPLGLPDRHARPVQSRNRSYRSRKGIR